MILSFKNKFLFLRGRNVAGTSVEIALGTICGPMDIVTPALTEDDIFRQKTTGKYPQNFARTFYNTNNKKVETGPQVFYNHMTFDSVAYNFGYHPFEFAEFLNGSGFTIFSIDRHPYDKVISQACYLHRIPITTGKITIEEAVDAVLNSKTIPLNYPIYTWDGGMASLIEYPSGLDWIKETYNVELPLRKESVFPYTRDKLTPKQKEEIQSTFHSEFTIFNWEK